MTEQLLNVLSEVRLGENLESGGGKKILRIGAKSYFLREAHKKYF